LAAEKNKKEKPITDHNKKIDGEKQSKKKRKCYKNTKKIINK